MIVICGTLFTRVVPNVPLPSPTVPIVVGASAHHSPFETNKLLTSDFAWVVSFATIVAVDITFKVLTLVTPPVISISDNVTDTSVMFFTPLISFSFLPFSSTVTNFKFKQLFPLLSFSQLMEKSAVLLKLILVKPTLPLTLTSPIKLIFLASHSA